MITKLKQWSSLATILLIITQLETRAESTINSLADLKAIQTKVEAVSKKVLPATVSLFSTKNGASGSGIIVSEDGLILTAGHVIRGADTVTIIFPDGKQERGKVLGANYTCLLYTSPSPRDRQKSRMPSSA